jgi:anti-anti-sigma regulatory factor
MRSESRNRLNAAVVEIFMNLLAAAWAEQASFALTVLSPVITMVTTRAGLF